MYLKNIEVQGFKSFAQKINFEFHNGITGIVGPNGSGKSNVGDAVRWVLGEQSAKQLRGGNMQDVIFSGTELRKPLSFASVAITLDNSDHQLPIEFNEVTVTRRLYRSGESEYLINGSSCRLKDINEMFYDTGIGKEGYSIIGQGQIDKILSGKPEDRRELFDEAAGIVKFKRRKNTTIKKLEEEHQNLVRVTDILSELTKQLEPLEKQSETAKVYLTKKEKLKELDINLFLLENEKSEHILKELHDKNALAVKEYEASKKEYEIIKEEYDKFEEKSQKLLSQIEEKREAVQSNLMNRQQSEGQINVLKEQITAGEQNEDHYRSRIQVIEEEESKRKNSERELDLEKKELHGKLLLVKKTIQEKEELLFDLQERIQETTKEIEEGKNEIIEILNLRANTKGKAQRFDTLMEQIDIRKAQLNQKILSLKSEEEAQETLISQAKEEYEKISFDLQELVEKEKSYVSKYEEIRNEIKEQTFSLEEIQKKYHREASRLESLKNITERYDGYGNSIRRVMEQKKQTPGIKGVVADLIHVEKDYEVAIETALGGSIQNIVTDHEQTAKKMIEFLKRTRGGRATFLPLNSINGHVDFSQKAALLEEGVIGLASDLVTVDKEYEALSKYLLGRVLVIDNIDHGILIARKYRYSFRMVTLEGESLNPGGSMSGGAFKNNSNLLGRRREIEEIESSVEKIKQELEHTAKSLTMKRETGNNLRELLADIQNKIRQQSIHQNTALMKLTQLEDKAKEIKSGYGSISREQEEIRSQIIDVKFDHDKIAKELEASQKDEKELEEYIHTKQKEADDHRQEEMILQKELEAVRLEESSISQREGFLLENLTRIKSEMKEFAKEKEILLENLEGDKREIEKKKQLIFEKEQEITASIAHEEKEKEILQKAQAERESVVFEQRKSIKMRDDLSEKIGLLDKECFRLKNQIERADEERENMISYMWNEYEITPMKAIAFKNDELNNYQELKNSIAQTKDEIRKLGTVNVNAIEDYKNVLERHTFLTTQYEDLQKAEETLKEIIQELDDGMRKQFAEKFKDIQREFDKAFKELFGGGKGSLELAEEADILEAGIHIISQPPGKKLQNMMQLSGGEKALTAIALLFAIQNLKPSPFCLLDEIEAALDDSNVGRFAGYLQKLTKNTQFIIITHRRGTMTAADRLYGITMQEKGVSTLVSVDLVERQLT